MSDLSRTRRAYLTREAHVCDAHNGAMVEQHIRWLQVAMNNVQRV